MDVTALLTYYRFPIETIYVLLVVLPSFLTYLKSRRIYQFSHYRPVHFFSLSFLWLSLAFLFRYAVMLVMIFLEHQSLSTIQSSSILTILTEFFALLPGFFLVYSLFWRRFHPRFIQITLYLAAALISIIDFVLGGFLLMYISQIGLFAVGSIIAYRRHRTSRGNARFKQLFTLCMLLFLIVWIANLAGQYLINLIPILRIYVYLITGGTALLFLHIVHQLTKGF
ncbi:MAG: hypothetical protein ACOCWQ_04510 [Nanoarchaeota archaeon]